MLDVAVRIRALSQHNRQCTGGVLGHEQSRNYDGPREGPTEEYLLAYDLQIIVRDRGLAALVLRAEGPAVEEVAVFVFLAALPVRRDTADNRFREDSVQVEELELLPAQGQTEMVYLHVAQMDRLVRARVQLLEQVQYHDGEL